MIDLFPNETIIFQWLIFVVAYFILNLGIFRPILRILGKRKSMIEGTKKEAVALEHESNSLLEECDRQINETRREGMREKEKQRQLAEKKYAELIGKVREEVHQEIDRAMKNIEQQMREASLQVHQYSKGLSDEIVFKILGRAA